MPNQSADHTLPLQVHDVGFLLDRLGEDCHPLQFLRELTQNAIEAIQKAAKTGRIGDGKIFISSIEEAIRIRTGETGNDAI